MKERNKNLPKFWGKCGIWLDMGVTKKKVPLR